MVVTTHPTARTDAVGFRQVFRKHFRKHPNRAVSGRSGVPRHGGRWSLAYAMRDMRVREGVEVGVLRGDSAQIWCTTNPRLHLTGIDPYEPYRDISPGRMKGVTFEEVSELLSPFDVTLLKSRSMDVVSHFEDQSIDFVHIDGDHSFDCCMQDLIGWVPKVRIGGLVLVHDFCSVNWNGVTQACLAYLAAHSIRNWLCTRDVSPTLVWERLNSHV